MDTVANINGRTIKAARYTSLAMAQQRASHAVKASAVMLGDDGRFWVVTPADAQRLERAGYEWAE